MGMNPTTDLDVIRKNPRQYALGTVIQIHDIGAYSFVEAFRTHPRVTMSFGIYVDGKSLNRTASTLDEALLVATLASK